MTSPAATAAALPTIRFMWNGIKDETGKLQPCFYALVDYATERAPEGSIRVYAKRYRRFSAAVRAHFVVRNDTDISTDYFDEDDFDVTPTHPLYAAAVAAIEAQEAHRAKTQSKRDAKYAAAVAAKLAEVNASRALRGLAPLDRLNGSTYTPTREKTIREKLAEIEARKAATASPAAKVPEPVAEPVAETRPTAEVIDFAAFRTRRLRAIQV